MTRNLARVFAGFALALAGYYFLGRPTSAQKSPNSSSARSEPTSANGPKVVSSNEAAAPSADKTRPSTGRVRKRPWDYGFLQTLYGLKAGDAVRIELVDGDSTLARLHSVRDRTGEVIYVSGDVLQPDPGKFFFQKQTLPGVAGDFAGVIVLDKEPIAYRLEPAGPNGETELVERGADEIVCREQPLFSTQGAPRAAEIPILNPANFPNLPIPPYQNGIIVLESLHGAVPVIYLDFEGGYTPSWGGINYERPNVSNAQIRDVWQRVAEDFMPFNINVTTDLAVFQRAPENSRQRVIITPTTTAASEAGGVAMIGSFNWTGDTPCWVFIPSGKGCGEACSHEAGHALGLTHEGVQSGNQLFEYYSGHGTGDTSWGPIMGLPYYANVTQWSKGEYLNPDNLQDQLAIITTQNNKVAYRPDDTGDTLATARFLELYPDFTAFAEGVIERSGDTDAFRFTTTGGPMWLRADPVAASPNLAIRVALYDQSDSLLAISDPQETLWADLATNLPAGTFTFRVSGSGRNNPLTNGFSNYGSLGYYSVTGTVANASLPDRFAIPEHATNGTFVGTISLAATNDDHLVQIVSGNHGNTFKLDAWGSLSVANNALLDYDTLASRAQGAIEFELFVDVIDKQNPALTETNRRVVVAITYVPTVPKILNLAQDLTVPAGRDLSLVASAIGDQPLSYQWFFNVIVVQNAQTPALQLTNLQLQNSGNYSLLVTNILGWTTSTIARLTVTSSPPLVVRQPAAQGAAPGLSAVFRVAAIGSEPLTYQWQFQGTNLADQTNATLVVSSARPSLVGSYRFVVSNDFGAIASEGADLVLEPVAAWGCNSDGQTNLYPELSNAVAISAGPNYNLALRSDSTVFCWGATNGMLVPATLTNATAVAAGGANALALRADGSVASWGANVPGQLAMPTGLSSMRAITAGGGHSLALRSDGRMFGWGLNTSGQATIPPLLTNVIAIAAGSNHSLALGSEGKVTAWGDNSFGQAQVPTNLPSAIAIAAGAQHSLALLADGTVVAWGDNQFGQCSVPAGLSGIIAVAAGAFHSLALNKTGTIFVWGAGQTSTLSYPNFGQAIVPQPFINGNITAIAGGGAHSLAFDGATPPFIFQEPLGCVAYSGHQVILRAAVTGQRPLLYQWQLDGVAITNANDALLVLPHALTNQAGNYQLVVHNLFGTVTSAVAKVSLTEASPTIAQQPVNLQPFLGGLAKLLVVAYGTEPLFYQWRMNGTDIPGATNSVLLLEDIRLDQSGYYSVVVSNALGTISSAKAKLSVRQVIAWGAGTNFSAPYGYGQSIVPFGMSLVSHLAGGSYHSLALEDAGRVVAWGAGTNTIALGGYNSGQSVVPAYLTDIIAVAGGMFHSLALRSDGLVFGWGASSGQAKVPTSLSNVIAIAAGNYHSVALTQDGRPVLWSSINNPGITNPPAAAVDLVAVASRGNQVVATRGDGQVIRWGSSGLVPAGLTGVVDVACGVYHGLALKSDGTVVSLDAGYSPPAGVLSNVVQIAAGSGFSLALRSDGTLFAWGPGVSLYGVALPAGVSNVTAIACGDYHCLASLGSGSVSICVQPLSRLVAIGDSLFLRVGATGIQPLSYQWYQNNAALLNATGAVLQLPSLQLTNGGNYCAIISNPLGSITSQVASVTLTGSLAHPVLPLQQALGGLPLVWQTSSNGWFGQTNVTFLGLPTAQSGLIGDGQQSALQTLLPGRGSLSFWWKVSSEQFFDFLTFYMDGILVSSISGEMDWHQVDFAIPPGPHTLKWIYQKDATASAGLDAGWLAQVSYSPDYPTIIAQPSGQTSMVGARIALLASATGTPPLTVQWFKDNVALPGAGDSTLVISNATRHNTGLYRMTAGNSLGTASTTPVSVVIRVPENLSVLPMLPGTFRLLSTDEDRAPLLPEDLAGFRIQSSTDLLGWVELTNTLQLTNGTLWLEQLLATNQPAGFYRVLEHSR